jgi:hypothetical protein
MTTLEKHTDAIKRGVVTKSNVIGIRKLINAAERREQGYSVSRTAATVTETLELRRLIAERQPVVEGELHESGVKVLRNPRYAKRWNERERAIIDRLHHFTLAGFDLIGRDHAVPVYRAVSALGPSFIFRNIPWQTAYYEGEESGPVALRDRR